ncbi:MAG: L,D-transpeptidase [Verrucomicrobiota bacterium]
MILRSPSPAKEEASGFQPRPATNLLEAQIALAQRGIGSGSLDGVAGAQTEAAFRAFQFQQGLEETGRRDPDTEKALTLIRPPWTQYVVTLEDLSSLHPVPDTWLGKSEVPRLGYATLLELLGEKTHAHPRLLQKLNPEVRWDSVAPGMELVVPDAEYPPPRKAALIRISLAGRYLRAFDGNGNLLAHFPVSIGRVAEKRPVGALTVAVSVKDPNYTFDPAVFPESEEGKQIGHKLMIPPGPNNPVGVAWIGLNRPGYGIHGTPVPEQVGRTESHGCFRLANWNAEYLRRMVGVGTPVNVER